MLFRRSFRLLQSNARFQSHSSTPKEGVVEKTKKEGLKMLRMQLVLVPLCVIVLLYVYPPMSAEEEKKAREKYEKSAGWKS